MLRLLQPGPQLWPHLVRACAYEERCPGVIREAEMPFAGAVLILVLGDPLRIDGERVRSFAGGLYDRPVLTERAGAQRLLQIDLTPLAARRLLGVPMSELTNRVVDAEELLGRDLVERAAQDGWPAVQAALVRRLADAPAPRREVFYAYDRIVASAGAVRVEELARELGWSRRHLGATFRHEVGVPPKTLARIVRFQRARELLAGGAELADVAYSCGFADQPHFTREVRDLGGTTPTALAA